MNKECSKREKKQSVKKGKEITDSTCDLKYYVCKALNGNDSIKITPNLSVLRIMSFSSDKIILLLNNYMVMEKKYLILILIKIILMNI